jgi:O-succinylhomoserine sulfhydrylase
MQRTGGLQRLEWLRYLLFLVLYCKQVTTLFPRDQYLDQHIGCLLKSFRNGEFHAPMSILMITKDLKMLFNRIRESLYLETPSNPGLDIIDLERIAAITKKHDLIFAVDNCFATPLLQRPLDFGADVSIHSATKYIDGQGRTLGGVILGSHELIAKIRAFARHTGPALSPFNAWTLSKSLETLDVRMERHCKNALKIAKRLEEHPAVEWVKYPFLPSHPQFDIAKKQMSAGGGIVSFELKGGLEAGRQFLDALNLFSLTANLGDTRSIATHPASTTHSKLTPEQREEVGISDGLVRLSIGLEHIDDIWGDIEVALAAE